jgi:hypothetical protein
VESLFDICVIREQKVVFSELSVKKLDILDYFLYLNNTNVLISLICGPLTPSLSPLGRGEGEGRFR